MFDWQDARYFLAVERTGSLSAAARQLGVNQSTVGRRLAALEEALGARLLVRTAEGYAKTDTGAELLQRFEALEAEALAIERGVVGAEAAVRGTVRLTAPVAFSSHFLGPRLAPLYRDHPELELEIVADNSNLSLTKREADLALRFDRPSGGHLKARKVGEINRGLYASRGYLARHGRPAGTDFAGHAVIGFDELFGPSIDGQWLARVARGARIPLRTDNLLLHLEAAVAGAGMSLLPHYLAARARNLEQVMAADVTRGIWLVTHSDLAHVGRVRAAGDFLAQLLQRDAALLLEPVR